MNESPQSAPASDPESIAVAVPADLIDLLVERVAARLGVGIEPAAEPWIGVEEAAVHLGCRRQRVYDLVCRRARTGIPHRKEGARLLFKRSALDRWIESGGAA